MSIKKGIYKVVGESFFAKDLYEYKKEIKDELEQLYKDEIKDLKDSLIRKQKQIDELIVIAKEIDKEHKEEIKPVYNKVEKYKDNSKDRFEAREETRFPFFTNSRSQNWTANTANSAR